MGIILQKIIISWKNMTFIKYCLIIKYNNLPFQHRLQIIMLAKDILWTYQNEAM